MYAQVGRMERESYIHIETRTDRHSPPATVLMNFLKMAGSLSPLKVRVSPLGEGERE